VKIRFLVLLILLFSYLFAQFDDPIQINQDLENVYFRGEKACQIIEDEVFLVFVEDSLSANLFFSHSLDGIVFENSLIDQNVVTREEALPTIEIMESGKILIYYCKEINDVTFLYNAVSIDNGSNFTINQLETSVSEFSSTTSNNEIYLSFKKDDEINLSSFQHFTDIEESENADGGLAAGMMKFWGPDVLWGPVHTNHDIWIQQAGGGPNNNWPTFHGQVVTGGIARLYPSGAPAMGAAPIDDIFVGGLEQSTNGVTEVPLPETAEEIQQNGISVGNPETDIVYVKMYGYGAEIKLGEIVEIGSQQFEVYSWFPKDAEEAQNVIDNGGNWFEDSDNIWINEITIYDTIWTDSPALSWTDEASFWIPDAELWIEGEVAGNVTFGCGQNTYIVNDIWYTNTIKGAAPDDPDEWNPTDYFGLVSEERIFIKYKHRNPFDPNYPIVSPNSSDGNVYLYGAYAALGKGDTLQYGNMACHYDGVITPEYQHPHGSTPNFWAPSPYTGNDTLYTYIDFHKFIFPINNTVPPQIEGFNLHGNDPQLVNNNTCGYPFESPDYINSYPNNDPNNYVYPYGTGYPWLNPVWPEPATDIIFERGTIHHWGSFSQRRRGYTHRSGTDPYNHPGDNVWDLDDFHFDGDHNSTGYDKNYFYDSRFTIKNPINFPSMECDNYQTIYVQKSYDEGNTFEHVVRKSLRWHLPIWLEDHQTAIDDDVIAVQFYNGSPLLISIDAGNYFWETEDFYTGDLFVVEGNIYLYRQSGNGNNLYELDPFNQAFTIIETFPHTSDINTFSITGSGNKVYTSVFDPSAQPIEINFDYTYEEPFFFNGNYTWQTPFNLSFEADSKLALNFNVHEAVYVSFLNSAVQGLQYGDLWLTKGQLPELTGTTPSEIIPVTNNLSNYPNPFNPTTTISFSLTTEITENTELIIYNLKGQKVKTFLINPSTNNSINSVIWNGTDNNNKPVGTGLYFCKLKVDGRDILTKKMLLLK
jgi:hypothetical protein